MILADKIKIGCKECILQCLYIPEDRLWECGYVDEDEKYAKVYARLLVGYGDTKAQAEEELQEALENISFQGLIDDYNGLESFNDFDTEKKRKIILLGRKVRRDYMDEWMTSEDRYKKWHRMMKELTGISFPPSFFNHECL